MGISEGNLHDPIFRRPNSRDKGLAIGRRPLPDHCLLLPINCARIRLVLKFCSKIVTLVADPVPGLVKIPKLLDNFCIRGAKF
jgi:hypothetical protein